MECFNITDYSEDNNTPLNNDEIAKACEYNSLRHLVITGWSERSIGLQELDEALSYDEFSSNNRFEFYSFDIRLCWIDRKDNETKEIFHCLVLSLDRDYELSVEEKLQYILKCSVKCFNGYINVALAYYGKENKVQCFFQTSVTEKNLDKVIETLIGKGKIHEFYEEDICATKLCCNKLCDDILNYYLAPGIETTIDKASKDKDDILRIFNEIKKKHSKDYFNIPDSVTSYSFHLYRHPKSSFPLPILLEYGELNNNDLWNIGEQNDENKKYDIYIPKTVLGYYTRHDKNGCNGPHIVLCPKNIKKEVEQAKNKLSIDEPLLYLIVLIHEFAHAMMDENNTNGNMKSIFAHAMEESLANMLTLKWFINTNDTTQVKEFIENYREVIYMFGINQFEAGVNWEKWRDSTKDMDGKLKDWFDTCFEGGKIRDIGSEAVRSAYDLIFNKD